jgi:transposase
MMGTKERNFSSLEDLSLEGLVPEDNFYRRLERTVDLSFVRELVRDRYASGGRPSVDPVVFFKLQLVLFFEDLRSERQLMEVAADRLSIRWYLGYDLDELLPDHSSLTRIRERYGLEIFRRFFEEIVELCIEAGLVWGNELFFDSTKVEANASVDSLLPRFAVEAHLERLFENEEVRDAEEEGAPQSPPIAGLHVLPTADDHELRTKNAAKKSDWISREGRQDRSFKSGYRKRTSDSHASRTDPDATPMTRSKGGTKLGYQTHYVVDGGKARIILGVLVTPSEVTENRPMLDLLWRAVFRWRLRPHHLTGDARYGTRENVAAIEKAGIRAYVAIPNFDFRDTGFFGPGHFRYDAQGDLYVCPAGQILRFQNKDHRNRRKRYRVSPKICNACTLKAKCTISEHGRALYRPFDEDFYDRVRRYRGTEPYEKALRKRAVWVEPLFGEAKEWHGMDRFRLRRLKKVNIEALMVAAGQNMKRLVASCGRGPKPVAQAVALRLPEPSFSYSRCHARRHHRCIPRHTRRSFSTRWIVFEAVVRRSSFLRTILLVSASRRT